jgi:hypothetical protein
MSKKTNKKDVRKNDKPQEDWLGSIFQNKEVLKLQADIQDLQKKLRDLSVEKEKVVQQNNELKKDLDLTKIRLEDMTLNRDEHKNHAEEILNSTPETQRGWLGTYVANRKPKVKPAVISQHIRDTGPAINHHTYNIDSRSVTSIDNHHGHRLNGGMNLGDTVAGAAVRGAISIKNKK